MADTALNLRESVTKAFEAVTNETEVENPVAETSVVETKEKEVETPVVEQQDEVIELDASADELRNSLSLQRDLQNPDRRADVLARLAKEAGYDLTKKTEQQQFKRDTKALFKEKLGNIYDLVGGDALADSIDQAIKERVEEAIKPTFEKVAKQEENLNQQRANSALETFFVQNKIEAKDREGIAAKMMKKMRQISPAPGVDAVDYLNDVYAIISRGETRVKVTRETVEKINKNAQEVNRTSGKEGPDDKRVVVKVKKLPSLRQAVEAGYRGEQLEME